MARPSFKQFQTFSRHSLSPLLDDAQTRDDVKCHYQKLYRGGENIMYDLDHMLNGVQSRNHMQELVKQAQLEKLAQEAMAAQAEKHEQNHKAHEPRRTVFTSAVLLLTRWG